MRHYLGLPELRELCDRACLRWRYRGGRGLYKFFILRVKLLGNFKLCRVFLFLLFLFLLLFLLGILLLILLVILVYYMFIILVSFVPYLGFVAHAAGRKLTLPLPNASARPPRPRPLPLPPRPPILRWRYNLSTVGCRLTHPQPANPFRCTDTLNGVASVRTAWKRYGNPPPPPPSHIQHTTRQSQIGDSHHPTGRAPPASSYGSSASSYGSGTSYG
eukprot:gene19280-biopygen29569